MSARRAFALAGLLAGSLALLHTAAADVTSRKTSPDQVTKAAGEAFADAVEADQKGDLRTALGLYRKAFEIAPHPSTIYNIADIQRRLGQLTHAIHSYETYLGLAPRASDREQVEALVATLARTPGTLLVTTFDPSNPKAIDLKRSYILVDGEVLVKPGAEPVQVAGSSRPAIPVEVRAGTHVVDVVTSISYGSQTCEVRPGERTDCSVHAPPRSDGLFVASASDRGIKLLLEQDGKSKMHTRFDLPAGRARLMLRDRVFECRPLVIDVAKGNDVVTYAFVGTRDYDRVERCRTLTIKQHRLRFE